MALHWSGIWGKMNKSNMELTCFKLHKKIFSVSDNETKVTFITASDISRFKKSGKLVSRKWCLTFGTSTLHVCILFRPGTCKISFMMQKYQHACEAVPTLLKKQLFFRVLSSFRIVLEFLIVFKNSSKKNFNPPPFYIFTFYPYISVVLQEF